MQAAHACISGDVGEHDTVVVAYSGGLDSTVLLHAAHRALNPAACRLSAIHINHGLSPNADVWAKFCADVCSGMKVPLHLVPIQLNRRSGEGIEGEARRLRMEEFNRHPARWVLLAHHADDQAETLLHNLLRGAGIRGAAAIPYRREKLLRPFLGLGRNILRGYAEEHGLGWIEDESNIDCRFTRNFLRSRVLPPIRERFPTATERLAAAAEKFGEANLLLDELALDDLADMPARFPLPMEKLATLSESRARNLLRALLAWQGVQAPDESRLKEFLRQLRTAGNDKRPLIELPTYRLWGEKRQVHFRRVT